MRRTRREVFGRVLLVMVGIWFGALKASAQTDSSNGACPPGAVCVPLPPPRLLYREPDRDYGARAFGVGVLGGVSAGLVLATGVALASSERLSDDPRLRGVWLGATIVTVPIVGFTAFAVRQRVDLKGFQQLLLWGFATWAGGVLNQGLQLSASLHDISTPWGLTLAAAGMSTLGITAFTIDALTTAHRTRLKQGYRVVATGTGIALTF